jgi:hypothetical protein
MSYKAEVDARLGMVSVSSFNDVVVVIVIALCQQRRLLVRVYRQLDY